MGQQTEHERARTVPKAWREEAGDLYDLVLARLGEDGNYAADAIPRRGDAEFVRRRLLVPMLDYGRRALGMSVLHVLLNLAIVVAGLSTSAIVAAGGESHASQTAIAIIGLLVGLLAGMNQLLRPGDRNLTYMRTWQRLRDESWKFIRGLGEYEEGTNPPARRAFELRIMELQRDAERVAEPGPQSVSQP